MHVGVYVYAVIHTHRHIRTLHTDTFQVFCHRQIDTHTRTHYIQTLFKYIYVYIHAYILSSASLLRTIPYKRGLHVQYVCIYIYICIYIFTHTCIQTHIPAAANFSAPSLPRTIPYKNGALPLFRAFPLFTMSAATTHPGCTPEVSISPRNIASYRLFS